LVLIDQAPVVRSWNDHHLTAEESLGIQSVESVDRLLDLTNESIV